MHLPRPLSGAQSRSPAPSFKMTSVAADTIDRAIHIQSLTMHWAINVALHVEKHIISKCQLLDAL